MLFVHAHMERPVADIFRLAIEAVVLGEPANDPGHAFARRAFEAKTLAGVKLQPSALRRQQLAPVEKRLGLGRRFDAVELLLIGVAAALAKRMKSPLWLSVPVISPVPSSTTFSIHIFSSSGSSGQRASIAAIGLGNGLGKNKIADEPLSARGPVCPLRSCHNRMILGHWLAPFVELLYEILAWNCRH
jgi:hypothetical protein